MILPHMCFGYGRTKKEGPDFARAGALGGSLARAKIDARPYAGSTRFGASVNPVLLDVSAVPFPDGSKS